MKKKKIKPISGNRESINKVKEELNNELGVSNNIKTNVERKLNCFVAYNGNL